MALGHRGSDYWFTGIFSLVINHLFGVKTMDYNKLKNFSDSKDKTEDLSRETAA